MREVHVPSTGVATGTASSCHSIKMILYYISLGSVVRRSFSRDFVQSHSPVVPLAAGGTELVLPGCRAVLLPATGKCVLRNTHLVTGTAS